MIEERRQIGARFGFTLFAAPAWDMLLDLYVANLQGRSCYLWPLGVASNVPMSTAHRKLMEMAAAGLIKRTIDTADRRRVTVRLSPDCLGRLDDLMDRRVAPNQ